MNNNYNYLKHDLYILLIILLVTAGLLAGLWSWEQADGGFSQTARGLLDFFSR
jgi:hypothetical protein